MRRVAFAVSATGAWLVAGAFVGTAFAGETFEMNLERQRAMVAEETGRPVAAGTAPSDLTFSIGGPDDAIPRMLAPEIPRKGAAVRWRETWQLDDTDRSEPRFRLGLTLARDGSAIQSLEDTAVVLPFVDESEFYVSVERRHWGPAWTSSLILDGAAPAVAAVGWRRPEASAFESRWLAWLGPWRGDVFMGHLEGHTTPADPWLIGMRLEASPHPGLEVGVSRTLQWGGKGRPENLHSLADALLGRDNVSGPDTRNEPGNQLAGVDARFRWDLDDRSVSLYAQAIGEDEAGNMPSHYIALLGTDVSLRTPGVDWRAFLEWSDTIASDVVGSPHEGVAYRHHIYLQGYTNDGRLLGAPIGGDVSHFFSLGAIADAGPIAGSMTLHTGRADHPAQLFVGGASLFGIDAALSLDLRAYGRAGLSAWHWSAAGVHDDAIQLWWRLDLR